MALTNTPKDQLTTAQVMFDMALAFKLLGENPDLEQLAKDAYALPEREQSKAEAALKAISDNQAVLDDIKKQQVVLDATNGVLDGKKADNDAALKRIEDGNRALDSRERGLNERAADLGAREKALDQRERDLQTGISKLAQDRNDLEAERKEIETYEASLKEKAAQLQKLTQGL